MLRKSCICLLSRGEAPREGDRQSSSSLYHETCASKCQSPRLGNQVSTRDSITGPWRLGKPIKKQVNIKGQLISKWNHRLDQNTNENFDSFCPGPFRAEKDILKLTDLEPLQVYLHEIATGKIDNMHWHTKLVPLYQCSMFAPKNSTLLQKWHITPKMTHYSKNDTFLQK